MTSTLTRLANRVERTTARVVAEAERRNLQPADLAGLRLPWYEVRNDSGSPSAEGVPSGESTIFIFDEIGGSLGIQASELVQDIENITAPTIKVRINSPGGSVFDAVAIYNALNHHASRVVVYVDSIAASAASVIAMAGDEVVMMPGSQMMIHDASNTLEGNADEHRQDGLFLDRQSDNIANLYMRRAGGTNESWRALMLEETWAFADESVALGLADRVEDPPRSIPKVTPDDELMTRSFDLRAWGYRYCGRSAAPAPGTSHTYRATTIPRANTREAAAEARRRAFMSREPISMPDMTQRTQTRSGAVGLDNDRRLPFAAELRGAVEPRNGRDMYHVHGYASVFDKAYPMWDSFGEYDEVVKRGAADRTLSRSPDVAFLLNHKGVTMARTTNGTLVLSADNIGLIQDAWVNPERADVQIMMSAIDDELITEMSFAFMIPEAGGWWSEDFKTFEIRQFDIDRGDVSAVNYGASPWTSIAARAREVLVHAADLPEGIQRALAARLGTSTTRRTRQAEVVDLQAGVEAKILARPTAPARERIPDGVGRKVALVEKLLADD